jgi:hypothetical protein
VEYGKQLRAGQSTVTWNGKDDSGKLLAPQTFTYKIFASDAPGNGVVAEGQTTIAR